MEKKNGICQIEVRVVCGSLLPNGRYHWTKAELKRMSERSKFMKTVLIHLNISFRASIFGNVKGMESNMPHRNDFNVLINLSPSCWVFKKMEISRRSYDTEITPNVFFFFLNLHVGCLYYYCNKESHCRYLQWLYWCNWRHS
jgi:hypothetical protein